MDNPNINYNRILNELQNNWITTIMAPALVVLASLWLTPTWLPFVTIGIVPVLILVGRAMQANGSIPCTLIRRYTEYGLAFSGVVMIAFNIAHTDWGRDLILDWLGVEVRLGDVPYVPSLIIYPVLTLMYILQLLRQGRTGMCRECASHSYTGIERRITHSIYKRQMTFLGRLSLGLAALASAVGLVYYFTFYIDVNLNRPDKFFFCIVPIGLTLLAIAYVFTHYSGLKFQMATMGATPALPRYMKVRFLVVRGNDMLLSQRSAGLPGVTFWDTPVTATEPYAMELPENEARGIFARASGCSSFTLRRLYRSVSDGGDAHVVYAAFIPEGAEVEARGTDPHWMTLHSIDLLYNSGQLAPAMQDDIHRIYTITMAWKTYTRDGRRLYPIKNYRPTFRLSDFKDWDVDYEDTHWMEVFNHNEDRPLWRLRRFWRRLVTGTSMR